MSSDQGDFSEYAGIKTGLVSMENVIFSIKSGL